MTKIANVYIVCDLTAWPKIPLKNVTLKSCFFGATNIVNEKDKWVFSGYGIAFDGGDWWIFGNSTTRNVIIFGVDNSLSSYVYNFKNNFLILGKGPTFGINGSFGSLEKKLVLILLKQIQNFAWVHFIMVIIVICLSMEKNN